MSVSFYCIDSGDNRFIELDIDKYKQLTFEELIIDFD